MSALGGLVGWVASCRALLAVGRAGSLRGERVTILVGMGLGWMVRGRPWQIGPGWHEGFAFAGAVRVAGGRLAGLSELGELRCGVCGGLAVEPVDSWIEGHPLAWCTGGSQ